MTTTPVDILHVVQTLEIGGLERVTVNLCRGLRGRFRVGVACLKNEGAFADELRADGIPVFSWGPNARQKPYTAFIRLRRLVRQCGVRVLHSHNTGAFTDSVLATRLMRGVRVINTDHARVFPDKRRYMVAERLCSYAAHRVVAVSEDVKRNLQRYEHIPEAFIDVIPNGIDTHRLRDLTPPHINGTNDIVIGTAARFSEEKRLDTLLDAAALLVERGLPIRVRLAGDGATRGALEAQAQRLGIADRVAFLGYQSDVAAVLESLDIFVLSSISEGMPMGVLEAMAAARPIVATTVGGVPEVLSSGETGLLVPPRDPEALADAIMKMAQEPDNARRMAEAARERALELYSLEAMANCYATLYDAVLEAVKS